MPLDSSMRFGCCGWKAGRGAIGICCQFVVCDVALGNGTNRTAAARIIEKDIRFVLIAHLADPMPVDMTELDMTEPDLTEFALRPARRRVLRPRRFRSRPRCGWYPERCRWPRAGCPPSLPCRCGPRSGI